ncbi:hypothetical protein BU23DRAFT_599772 [Bimuria novae-zelandiae CBS 107.79]|uniref:Uncharacterized protein n=1 Tax=Bimuria novae-zelandiae CBS 107.79 TaxID=1447943 RepID=A0A6A5VG90_9PLEO|nr:hypothetical protein BU23DRAFT_599772 [Bimuria novae-zelandiae CBS 107.79]
MLTCRHLIHVTVSQSRSIRLNFHRSTVTCEASRISCSSLIIMCLRMLHRPAWTNILGLMGMDVATKSPQASRLPKVIKKGHPQIQVQLGAWYNENRATGIRDAQMEGDAMSVDEEFSREDDGGHGAANTVAVGAENGDPQVDKTSSLHYKNHLLIAMQTDRI